MPAPLHLLKLCVGCESVEDLALWQAERAAERRAAGDDPRPFHVTRMWPRRDEDLLAGGSLYWIIKGRVLARQAILGLEPRRGEDGVARCLLRLSPEVVRTLPQTRRAFQGWRYLRPEDAPADLGQASSAVASLPPRLLAELAEVGVL